MCIRDRVGVDPTRRDLTRTIIPTIKEVRTTPESPAHMSLREAKNLVDRTETAGPQVVARFDSEAKAQGALNRFRALPGVDAEIRRV